MSAWPSIAATPPSTIYPPDGSKWLARPEIVQAIHTSALGRELTIITLQGWLRGITGCNAPDPDWHYDLEIDGDWLAQLGLSPADLARPGDLLITDAAAPTLERQRSGPLMVHIELDGWQRNDTVRGQPPKPLDWKTVVPECDPNVTWPFDPRVDAAQKELAVGMYVQVTGSLVTDEPHSQEDQLITNMILRLGLPATINWVTANRPGDTTSVPRGANNAAKWIWSDGLTNNARAHPCRWNEIHSPDYFRVIDERQPSRVLQMVAVCAQNGLFSGDVNHFAVDLQGPANRPANTVLAWRSHDTQWTRASSVKSGPTVTVADGHITVDVTVQGDSAMGHSGTFCEIYELWWQPAVRRINVPTVSVAVLDQPVTITVSAADSATGAPIAGDVFMDGNRVAAVGQTFSWTFGSHMEWVVDTGPDGKPRRYRVRVADPVDGHVAAAGYLHGPIVFDLPVGDL